MKSNFLLKGIIAVLMFAGLTSSAFAGIITSATFTVGGVALVDGGSVPLGSTIALSIDVTVPNDGAAYQVSFWELGVDGNSQGWINGISNSNTKIAAPAGTSTITGSHTLLGTAALDGMFRLVVFKDNVQVGATEYYDLAVTYTGTAVTPVFSIDSIRSDKFQSESNWGGQYTQGEVINFTVYYESNTNIALNLNFFEKTSGSYTNWTATPPYYTTTIPATSGSGSAVVPFTIPSDAILGINDVKAWIGSTWSADVETVSNFTIVEATALNENKVGVSIYPNPATDNLIVKDADNSLIKLISASGAVVKTITNASADQSISVADLASGLYFVNISKDGVSSVSKVMVK